MAALLGKVKDAADGLALPDSAKSELLVDIATIESQTHSPHPKEGIIRESWASIRKILEGAATSALTQALLAELGKFL